MIKTKTTWAAVLAVGVTLGAVGCKDDTAKSGGGYENVTVKTAPANPGDAPQPASGPEPVSTQPVAAPVATPVAPVPAAEAVPAKPVANASAGQRESADGVSFELPAGWSTHRENNFRLVTVTDGKAEIAVTAFPGNVGGILANVNRWRGQVGLPPVASEADARKDIREVEVEGKKFEVVDLAGSAQHSLVAIVPGEAKLYFFKMTATPEIVAERKAAFDQLVKTIRVE